MAGKLDAQQWNEPRAIALVRQAAELRAQQLADSGLVDYQASAHGYLTFLAQLGEGFRDPPQVVKADELALQVYWRAPNLSKQVIVGRRDTTLLPTDIQYHRDHLGIVQNNFPAIIRLGDGDEVKDVPHPLSLAGLEQYDFALSDSLRMTIPGRVIGVYEVKVRPKDDRQPRVIGALYVDRDDGQVVRMALSFTRAAFLDKQLEDLFVVLENGLVGTRFWLPRRQEIEIRRSATWLDYPIRGIIRGRWEIGEYQLNTGLPHTHFMGPEIVQAPPVLQRSYNWPSARILDSLPPDIRAVTADEIKRVQAEVRALVREQALRRSRSSALAARGISDFVRYNRVEGAALGFGASGQLGAGFSISGGGRYGLADREAKGRLEFRWQNAHGRTVRLYGGRDYRDMGDVPERSLLVNSLAAQEFGSDYTELFRVEAFGASLTTPVWTSSWTIDLSQERHSALVMHANPAWGRFEPPMHADSSTSTRARLIADRPPTMWRGFETRARGELRAVSVTRSRSCAFSLPGPVSCGSTSVFRAAGDLELQRELGGARLVSRTIGALVHGSDHVPVQEMVYFGGPVTAPGYDYHTLVGDRAISQRLELQLPVPFPAFSLGRFGRSASRATLAPFVTHTELRPLIGSSVGVGGIDQNHANSRLLGPDAGSYPSVGVGVFLFFDLLRLDVARGLRHDGRWSFSLDVHRRFWSVL